MRTVPAPSPPPPPPWTCRLRAVVRLGLGRGHLIALAVVAYDETPVGPYGEALLARVRLPLRVTVPWIVVDSAASRAAGRQHWALPKELASFAIDPDRSGATVRASDPPAALLRVTSRAAGPRVPVRLTALLEQPGRGPAVLRFRGRARPALVRAVGGPSAGTGPGALLDGVLRLGAPRTSCGTTAAGPEGGPADRGRGGR